MTSKGTILIVEDNELNVEMVKELLEEVGFQTLEADDTETGIQLAKQEHPDLILMDIYLPGQNGYEASQALKSDPETYDIPIVAFTALAMDKDRQRAEAAGCIGVISKPIDIDHFAETVASYLQNKSDDPKSVADEVTIPLFSDETRSISEPELREFLMKLSHDLQAPIRKVEQFSKILRKVAQEKLSPEDCDLLGRIEQLTQQMQDVLNSSLPVFYKSRR